MNNIKEMKLYSDAYRIFKDLKALGYSEDDKFNLEDVNQFDQLHYHGTLSVQKARQASRPEYFSQSLASSLSIDEVEMENRDHSAIVFATNQIIKRPFF